MNSDITLVALGVFAFCGGLIDAAVGGGGLVQIPALIHALPNFSLATVFGTNKLAVLLGNSFSISSYLKRVRIVWKLILPIMVSSFVFSFVGASSVALIPRAIMEYIVFFILVVMAVYTFVKKDLGRSHLETRIGTREILLGVILGGFIGFYDGVFGPGSGSLLLFSFVKCFRFDFLNASASAKLINLGTFSAALLFFIPSGHVLWIIGGVIGICNIAGAITGVFLALRYGSGFIRIFFLILLLFLIGRMGFSIFF
ncbi:putative membrane protein YfcA [Azospirillum lipoferum]|uniref:Probable membrane transporter protein n=1 Tax=Azospirillum lipoferum TaxID=193 RepID=A0A5A9GDG0_AZOLI|nr:MULTISPECIES: TSUP family transporter [Azospirillum]KAA0592421.1 TSUP family transporter [Azospirillum lipoferum]MCP1614536.1 putative membrane protein YfcA [Azospirillum lipoferum]MDW5532632.1 TSUP family transporter [Azospirillum sp. NL1]